MSTTSIKLPRRRFFRVSGNVVEMATGLLVLTILESRGASAETARQLPLRPLQPAQDVDGSAIDHLDPRAVKKMSVAELKAMLDDKTLAALHLDKSFLKLLDTDSHAAVRKLETALRKQIQVAAREHHKTLAAAGDDGHHHHGDHDGDRAESDAHHDAGLLGLSPLLLIAGIAVIGGGAAAIAATTGHHHENHVPVAANDAVTTNEDTAVTFDPRSNDSDSDKDPLTITAINGTAITTSTPVTITGGTISLGTDGRLTFTPSANYNGAPSFTYTVSDGHGGTTTATVNLTVTAVNDAPVAANDSATTAEDTPVTINVLANDKDVDNDTLTVTQVNGSAVSATTAVAVTGGSVILNAAGNLVFTPSANYNGTPSFTYTVSDGHGGTSTGTVNLTVTAVNDAPVNTIPSAAVAAVAGTPVLIAGLAVSDVDSTSLTTTITVASGSLSYGTVTGGATVSGNGTGTLTLAGTIDQINASLKAISYTGTTSGLGAVTLTMTTSDGSLTDTDTLTLTVGQMITGHVEDGYVSGALVFYDANGNGTYDSGEAVAKTDAQGKFSMVLPGAMTGDLIAIGGTNTDTGLPNNMMLMGPPGATVISPLTTLVAILHDGGMSLDAANATVLQGFGLPAGVNLSTFDFLAQSDPANAATAFAIQKASAEIANTLAQGMKAGLSSTAIFNALAGAEQAGHPVDLTDSDALQALFQGIGLSADAAHQAALNAAGVNEQLAQASTPDQVVHISQASGQPNANLPPVTHDDSVTTDEDHAVTFDPRGNDADPEGRPLIITAINGLEINVTNAVVTAAGTFTLGADGQLTFTPASNYHGAPSFTYTVADDAGNTQNGVINLTVNPVNDAPITVNDAAATAVDTPVTIDALANDIDVDGDRSGWHIIAVDGQSVTDGHAATITGPSGVVIGTATLDQAGEIVFSPADGYVGDASFSYTVGDSSLTSTGQVTTSVQAPADGVLHITDAQFPGVVENGAALHAAGVTTLDVADNTLTITSDQATALIQDGLHFAADDTVTLQGGQGTHLSTTLKALQDLHVSNVAVTASTLVLAAGGDLGSISASGLPHFVSANGGHLDVTLDLASGAISPTLDLASIATGLQAAGVDHLDTVNGSEITLTVNQGEELAAHGIDFTPAADVALAVTDGELHQLAIDPSLLGELHVDHLAIDSATITDTEASALIAAGVDFAAGDVITVQAQGTHLSTSLKALQDLHVSNVAVTAGGTLVLAAGTDDLNALSAHTLPHFASDLNVTVDLNAGSLSSTVDLGAVSGAFAAAGVDHIGVVGNGELTIDLAQAEGLGASGLDFDPAASVHLALASTDLPSLADNPFAISGLNIDTIDVTDHVASITDSQAANLIQAGLEFAAGDTITVAAQGTHMSTTLKGLHDLHVTSISAGGLAQIHIDAGDIHTLTAADLPSFELAQTDAALDVTLRVDSSEAADVVRLADALRAAGVDHIAFNQQISSFDPQTQAEFQQITQHDGLTFTYEDFTTAEAMGTGSTAHMMAAQQQSTAMLFRELATGFVANDDPGHGGAVQLDDGAASSLAESGMLRAYVADTVTVDATGSGDKLLTTLKEIGDLGVDKVQLADQHGKPVYVDLGIGNDAQATSDITALFKALDLGEGKIFAGTDKVALVVDADTAKALSHVDGALDHLAHLGFTEVDVVATPTTATAPAFAEPAIQVQLIGQDDELYKHLHH